MFNKIFPLRLHLHVLQLEEYSPRRFVSWILKNYHVRSLQKKKQLVWTQKAKLIYTISIFYIVAHVIFLSVTYSYLGLIVGIILSTQTYIFLLLATITLRPYESLNRIRVRAKIKQKIINLKAKGLKVIGITGSYGKTTTKNFLYSVLKTKYRVLKTPESYNTLFGIYKVIDLELDENYDYFICEMGAYKRGEIKELCDVVLPDHGILMGINEQHLERFGSLENTTKAKFELIEALPEIGVKLLNIDSPLVMQSYKKYVKKPELYGFSSKTNFIENVEQLNGSITCDFCVDGKKMHLSQLKIFGNGNVSNTLAAATMGYKLGVPIENIVSVLGKLEPILHRLSFLEREDGVTIIDDSYSSNLTGFKIALEVLASFKSRPKILVTPGIVELGSATQATHLDIGKLVNQTCDFTLLVGESIRTRSIAKSLSEEKYLYISGINELTNALQTLPFKKPVVLIENDLPENY